MSARFVIVGAGGFGRGVYRWITTSPNFLLRNSVSEVVFLGDKANLELLPGRLLSNIEDYIPEQNDRVLCAVAAPAIRSHLVNQMVSRGVRFGTFVDDRVVVAGTSTIGEGSIICPGTVLGADVILGKHVHVNFNCSVGHDSVVGDFSTLSPAVNIMGEVRVGEGVFIGGSAVILPRTSLGEHAVVGAGAVVLSGADPHVTMVGNPARPTRGTH